MTNPTGEIKRVSYQLPSGDVAEVMLEWVMGDYTAGEPSQWGYWEFVSAECDGSEIKLSGAEIMRIEDLFN